HEVQSRIENRGAWVVRDSSNVLPSHASVVSSSVCAASISLASAARLIECGARSSGVTSDCGYVNEIASVIAGRFDQSPYGVSVSRLPVHATGVEPRVRSRVRKVQTAICGWGDRSSCAGSVIAGLEFNAAGWVRTSIDAEGYGSCGSGSRGLRRCRDRGKGITERIRSRNPVTRGTDTNSAGLRCGSSEDCEIGAGICRAGLVQIDRAYAYGAIAV